MARIRTIKPDFWTDSKIVALSIPARLLFIGMWNFADDYGCIDDDPMQLRLRIFPADPVDIEPLTDEIVKLGLVRPMVNDVTDETFYLITNWRRHQKISHRSQPRYGDDHHWRVATDPRPMTPDEPGGLASPLEPSGGLRSPPESSGGRQRTPEPSSPIGRDKEGKGIEKSIRVKPDGFAETTDWTTASTSELTRRGSTPWIARRVAEHIGYEPPIGALYDGYMAVIQAVIRSDHPHQKRLAAAVIGEYLERRNDIEIPHESWGLISKAVRDDGPIVVMEAMSHAAIFGAGEGEYAADPRSIGKYVGTIIAARRHGRK